MSFTQIECQNARKAFPILQRMFNGAPLAFFDGPAGSQVPESVITAMSNYYRTCNANSHGEFVTSMETDAVINGCRQAVANFLGAQSIREISFGQNMTTLNFSLSHALARKMKPGDEIVITQLDHEANRGPWLNLAEKGMVIKEVKLNRDGRLDYNDFESKITKRTKIVAIGYASNALGTVNDIKLARALSKSAGAFLVIDAVHYAPHFPIDVTAIDTDFLLCSAYKFYGPHVGILYSRPGLLAELKTDVLRTQMQEPPYLIETGTLNHAALAGVKAAVDFIASWGTGTTLRQKIVSAMQQIGEHEHELGKLYYENVRSINGVTVWGPDFSDKNRAPTISITIKNITATEAAKKLGERGILVWNGDFYAVKAVEVFGLVEQGGLIRTGMLMYNTKEEVERLIAGVEEISK